MKMVCEQLSVGQGEELGEGSKQGAGVSGNDGRVQLSFASLSGFPMNP